jgi:hypothetical protein
MRLNFGTLITTVAGLTALTASSLAYAGATVGWTETTGANQPAGYRSFDLQVSLTGTSDFTSARLLTTGTFFQDATFGGNTAPNPAIFQFDPQLEFDTYVTSPDRTSTLLLGGFDGTNDTTSATFTTSTISAAWGDVASSANGTYALARLTFSSSVAFPTVSGRVSYGNPGDTSSITSIALPQINSPEPSSIALAGVGAAVALRRRRKAC